MKVKELMGILKCANSAAEIVFISNADNRPRSYTPLNETFTNNCKRPPELLIRVIETDVDTNNEN